MFQVFDCGRPADCHHCKVHESWDNSIFESFEEAHEYACNWVGYHPSFEIDVPYDYSGCGDTIEIRSI